jgi:hypothetical protein
MRPAVLGPERDGAGYPLRSVTWSRYPRRKALQVALPSPGSCVTGLRYLFILKTQSNYIPQAWKERVARHVTFSTL